MHPHPAQFCKTQQSGYDCYTTKSIGEKSSWAILLTAGARTDMNKGRSPMSAKQSEEGSSDPPNGLDTHKDGSVKGHSGMISPTVG